MFSQLSEQVKKSSLPASDLFAANLQALQEISKQQTSLVSGILEDSMKLIKSVGEQTEVNGFIAAQSVYGESVRERITATSKQTYDKLTEVSQQYADTMKTSFETASSSTTPTSVSPATTPVAKKAAPAKKATPAKKAVSKSTAKATTKPVAKKAVAKPAVKKATAKPATKVNAEPVKTAPTKVETNKPAVKEASKTEATSTTANVKAKPATTDAQATVVEASANNATKA